MQKDWVKFVQKELEELGYSPGPIDGLMGKKTRMAMANIADIPMAWSDDRKIIAMIQYVAIKQGLDVGRLDGLWGPQTEYGYEELVEMAENGTKSSLWRDTIVGAVSGMTSSIEHANQWPTQEEKGLIKYYGEIGENQTYLQVPYPHRLAWDLDTEISRYSCHEKVHDSLERTLKRVVEHYGQHQIEELRLDLFGGCLNVRKMRGGSKWSMHSWGIAADYDPSHNKLRWGKDRAQFANTAYDEWWKIWEAEAWVSLGREKNYDWMHIQAAKIS